VVKTAARTTIGEVTVKFGRELINVINMIAETLDGFTSEGKGKGKDKLGFV